MESKEILEYCIQKLLILLNPFMPAITEKWQQILFNKKFTTYTIKPYEQTQLILQKVIKIIRKFQKLNIKINIQSNKYDIFISKMCKLMPMDITDTNFQVSNIKMKLYEIDCNKIQHMIDNLNQQKQQQEEKIKGFDQTKTPQCIISKINTDIENITKEINNLEELLCY